VKDNLYTLGYAVAVGTICAGLLTAAAEFTAPYREANQRADQMRNILAVLEIPVGPGAGAEELAEVFEQRVRREKKDAMTVYFLVGDDPQAEPELVAIDVEGRGLWGPIRGFVSLEPDWDTIRGVTFHDHNETPGLGAEISHDIFLDQFRGKRLTDEEGEPALQVVTGGADGPWQVDGISGATITCDRVGDLMRDLARQIQEVR
jgi:Na+-transporting NADH:ubiquinone oxidoreductase subunit C